MYMILCKVGILSLFSIFSPFCFPLLLLNLSLLQSDPSLEKHRLDLITSTAKALDKAKMVRYVEHTGTLHATDLGRTASHYYIKYASIEVCV